MQLTYPVNARSEEKITLPDTRDEAVYLNDIDLSEDRVRTAISKMPTKWSTTPDGLPSGLFKKIKWSISLPLSMIFRRSLDSGCVPNKFRESIVDPVHKKGRKTLVENKRPVSLTVIASKIMESIIIEDFMNNAETHNLISVAQFGYRKGKSTVLQLLETYNGIALSLNSGIPVDMVVFDFKSAFKSSTHKKLIGTLTSFGIGTKIQKWIQGYLSNRTFRVKVGPALSSTGYVTSGCPQRASAHVCSSAT